LRHGGLIGGEESGGVSVQGHIPEKDGILTALLMLELIATTGEELGTLLNKLHQRLGPRAFIRIDQALTDKAKQQLMAALKDFDKTHFAGRKIIGRNDIDGVKLLFEDDSWVLMRPSGTEPVVRTYIEVTTPETLGRFKAQVLDAAKSLIA